MEREEATVTGEFTMATGARQAMHTGIANGRGRSGANGPNGEGRSGLDVAVEEAGRSAGLAELREGRTRVFVAVENRMLQDALSRMLAKRSDIEVVGMTSGVPFEAETLQAEAAEVLLMTSRGYLSEDVATIRKVRVRAPEVQILLLGVTGGEAEFLQYVRAGIKGYLQREASAEDVLGAVKAVHSGHAVCPGTLCALLFRYFEREATAFPSAAVHQRLGLTRREQQLIPLIAQGLTNKEIANHFCLSEQTVKNHLYRMKQKVGADDRLGIVQVCQTQGFLL
jgi:DNA-binding NarL/FixJ family response regulator